MKINSPEGEEAKSKCTWSILEEKVMYVIWKMIEFRGDTAISKILVWETDKIMLFV